ncbi:MAG TPA: hypothetical protein VFY39_06615 [Gammaproteobacteria bacterium]|nr:hypothetical protein [Gammaproteobacteria bacterium]
MTQLGNRERRAMTIEEKKALIAEFLVRCNAYAEEKLSHYSKELPAATSERAAELREKIRNWSVYRKFNDQALAELEAETLDDWFA